MRTVLFMPLVLALLPGSIPPPLAAQDTRSAAPEGDTTSLIPSAIKDYQISLEWMDRQLPVRVQYAVQGQTIFVLPVWAAGMVERVIDGKSTPLKPDDRLLPADEKRAVRLNVTVRNLLEIPELEKTIIEQLRQRVLDQQGLDASTKFKLERPNINPAGIRFTLIGGGRGDETSPAEIAVANPVSRPLDGVLSFTIDATAVRKIETDRSLNAGLVSAAVSVLPTGPMKVRFERLEMDAQIRYLRVTLDDFRKRVGSMVNPSASQSPDMIIPLGNAGQAETKSQLRSMLLQSLQVTVSTRQGVTELPLMPLLEKALEAMLEESKLDTQNDQQRVTFLLDNQVTISATLGEIKRLSKLDQSGRAEALKQAYDHYAATRKGEVSSYSGSLNVNYSILGGSTSGAYLNSTLEGNENRTKLEQEQQKQAFDKLMQEFEGRVPTLSGIQIDDQSLSASTKQAETRFQRNRFFVDYTLHRFTALHLSGTAEVGVSLAEMLRNYAILKAKHQALQKLVGTPELLTEARTNLEQVKVQAKELEQKSKSLDQTLNTFKEDSRKLLAQVDEQAVVKLGQDVARLKRNVGKLDFASREDAFTNLNREERPPGIDCTGPTGADARTVQAAQKAWARYLGETNNEKAFPLTEDGKVTVEMCLLPPGKYYRGSPENESGRSRDEDQSIITITQPLWVSRYEVTQIQYQTVMGSNPSRFKKEGDEAERFPVESVTYYDCVKFTRTATQNAAAEFRLLREAEWEYAYRAGTRTRFYNGDSDENLGDIAQYHKNSNQSTQTVGSKLPNAFGLYDMAGNVWEWCSDWYARDYDSETKDPRGHGSGSKRLSRGGSWWTTFSSCRAAYRHDIPPTENYSHLGFRLARVP